MIHWRGQVMPLVMLVALTGAAQQRDRPAMPATHAEPTGRVSGVVTLSETGREPVRSAVVSLIPVDGGDGASSVTDDDEGRFTIQGVADGRYALVAQKPAYLTTHYGATRPGRAGVPIVISKGQAVEDLRLALPKGAVITGRLAQEKGAPARNVQVLAIPASQIAAGGRFDTRARRFFSDDQGVYRIYGLPPGDYIVAALPEQGFGEVERRTAAEYEEAIRALRGRTSAAAQDQPPVFKAEARLVQVSVAVRDRHGRPVKGLTAAAFQVFEDGREQTIQFVEELSGDAAVMHTDTASDESGIYTNMAAGQPAASVTAILFDRLNTRWEDQAQARRHVLSFLKQIRPGDRLAIYVLDSAGIRVLHDFTSDRAALMRAAARAAVLTSHEVTAATETPLDSAEPGDRLMAELLESGQQTFATFFAARAAEVTMAALQGIGRHLAGVRGRKNLVWITGGFSIEAIREYGITATRELQGVTHVLNDSEIALYTVDARGLIGAFTYGAGRPTAVTLSTVHTNLDVLVRTAQATGGLAFHNSNDLGAAIRQSVDDGRDTYLLGYSPAPPSSDGTFRQIKVQVKAQGLTVRHRSGYFATAPPAQDAASRDRALDEAIRSPLTATRVGLRVRMLPEDTSTLNLSVTVAPASVTLLAGRETWRLRLDLRIAGIGRDGSHITYADDSVELDLDAAARTRFLKSGVTIGKRLTHGSDVQRIVVVVRDLVTGAIGSVSLPIERSGDSRSH